MTDREIVDSGRYLAWSEVEAWLASLGLQPRWVREVSIVRPQMGPLGAGLAVRAWLQVRSYATDEQGRLVAVGNEVAEEIRYVPVLSLPEIRETPRAD